MSVPLYMDHHVQSPITEGLRARGIDVLTTYEDHRARLADELLLDRAAELGRLLFTQEDLKLISKALDPEDVRNQVYWLPL